MRQKGTIGFYTTHQQLCFGSFRPADFFATRDERINLQRLAKVAGKKALFRNLFSVVFKQGAVFLPKVAARPAAAAPPTGKTAEVGLGLEAMGSFVSRAEPEELLSA